MKIILLFVFMERPFKFNNISISKFLRIYNYFNIYIVDYNFYCCIIHYEKIFST